jgi:hypothetical protein
VLKIVASAVLAVAVLAACQSPVRSEPCPDGVASCKVMTLTPEEEKFLTQPGGILDTAERGRLVDLAGPVRYFREKIANAPAGTVKKPSAEPGK